MTGQNIYRITVTGDPGSGKTTFASTVAEQTGFRLITTGNIFRRLAAEHGVSLNELNEMAETQARLDHEVDDYLKTLNDLNENLVLDSRMGWFFVNDSLKVRLTVDPDVAAARIFSDKAELRGLSGENFSTLQTAIDEVERRKRSEVMRYHKLYGVDISDPGNFDLVINTSHKEPDDVTREFKDRFAFYKTAR